MSAVPSVAASRPLVPVWLLVLITLSGTLGMHMFVPALPQAALDLGTGTAAMQMTISLYIAGLAVGQLIYGPLSDAFGRRPMLLGALALYTAAGVIAALSTGIHALIAARLLQALGGSAGLVLGRAIVRDTVRSDDAVRKLALLNLMMVIGPGLAPIVGGLVATHTGWRSIFLLLALTGAVAWGCAAKLLPETGHPTGRLSPRSLARDYRELLASPRFLGFAIGGGCSTTAFYAFLAAAPFIFAGQLHRPPAELGFCLALLMIGFSVGNASTSRLVRFMAPERVLMAGNLLSVACAALLLALAGSAWLSVGPVMLLMFLFTVGAGSCSPVALARAISVDPRLTGSAAGLYGCAQMVVGAISTALVSLGSDPAISAAAVLTLMAVVARVGFVVGVRHHKPLAAA
ncbi:Bcr/CflA family efflux MFS transporter [Xylophilus rhododendri]|uniref:Bcr/CflA family efflux transporter n=1 Tax=Xylophilus rhododendri TaxID=2697032 RepID=A0A857J745_9BURK|nr:multidrug effflux MFS transporter [Xylophilus rhododendri]QHI98608.1 Bcr/CflA family efflux MFS transporter [Xylophilus rhododendri]